MNTHQAQAGVTRGWSISLDGRRLLVCLSFTQRSLLPPSFPETTAPPTVLEHARTVGQPVVVNANDVNLFDLRASLHDQGRRLASITWNQHPLLRLRQTRYTLVLDFLADPDVRPVGVGALNKLGDLLNCHRWIVHVCRDNGSIALLATAPNIRPAQYFAFARTGMLVISEEEGSLPPEV